MRLATITPKAYRRLYFLDEQGTIVLTTKY
jgi:hypothetical protein